MQGSKVTSEGQTLEVLNLNGCIESVQNPLPEKKVDEDAIIVYKALVKDANYDYYLAHHLYQFFNKESPATNLVPKDLEVAAFVEEYGIHEFYDI